jgi:Methyltransferase domain
MDEIVLSSLEPGELVSGLHALVTPSLDPIFWLAERISASSAWCEHVPFGHWIVSAARPRVLVELGTHVGVSYSAFCQAVARSGLETRCYAVDTWCGESHAGQYGDEVFEEFRRFHNERYRAFSTLLRTTFDEALAHFPDGAVDFLHIDGFHTYEAVRHDFESWQPKLSRRAVVLFQGTNELRDEFGVWRLWAALCKQYPHFEFLHGHGLGVLAVGESVEPAILALCHLSDSRVAALRCRFAVLGERYQSQVREQLRVQDVQLAKARAEEEAEAHRQALAKASEATARAEQAELAKARAEQTQHEVEQLAKAWETRALENVRAREQITQRITAARRDVYDANYRCEQAEARAQRAEVSAALASVEAGQARAELNAIVTSTAWQTTTPLRAIASRFHPRLRSMLRGILELAWWSLTLKLPRKIRERRALGPR